MSKSEPALTLYKGDNDTITFTVTYTNPTGVVDLGNAVVNLTIRDDDFGEVILEKKSTDATQIEITGDGSAGEFKVYFIPADTKSLEPKKYVFDVEITLSDGTIHTAKKDYIELTEDITNN